jgi:thiol:disulfide interchange protein
MKIVLTALLVAGIAGSSFAQVKWSRDLEAAKKQAKKEKKLIFVDFFAEWCGPCKRMEREVFSTKKSSDLFKNFICVKQDVDGEGQKSARKYGVTAMPSLYVMDANGKVILYYVGALPQEGLEGLITEAKKRYQAKKN